LPSPTLSPVADKTPRSRGFVLIWILFDELFIVIAWSFRRIGFDEAATDVAVYEAEDPEGHVTEGMPSSLDHVDPIFQMKC
jgi:hypothetical protein